MTTDNSSKLAALSAFSIALAIGAGAFGAHALKDVVPPGDIQIWEKAVLYHLFNALGALVVVLLSSSIVSSRVQIRVAALLLLSVVVFSGSLYLLVLLNQRWLGAITPLGGSGFMLAWMYMGWQAWKTKS